MLPTARSKSSKRPDEAEDGDQGEQRGGWEESLSPDWAVNGPSPFRPIRFVRLCYVRSWGIYLTYMYGILMDFFFFFWVKV